METAPSIRNRTRRWYLVVQARRLMDAGYSQKDTAQRLGIAARSIRRWKNDEELWAAAAVAPDHEAVGPPKRTTSVALRALQDTTVKLEKDRQRLERRTPPAEPPADRETEAPPETAPAQHREPERRTGRYSGLTGTPAGSRVGYHEADPAPLDITGELALTRSLLERVALSIESEGAIDLDVVKVVARMLDQVSKMVQRVEAIRARNAISPKDFRRLMRELGRAVRELCTEEQAAAIAERVLSMRV